MASRAEIKEYSDSELVTNLEAISSRENEATVELLLHLAEVEGRKLHLEAGYSSLFNYCTDCAKGKLRYSETAALRRISAARAVSKFPELADLLRSKALSLTTLALVSKVLTTDNWRDVIGAVKGKGRREVDSYLAGLRPRAEIKERIRPIVVSTKAAPTISLAASLGSLFEAAAKSAGDIPKSAGSAAARQEVTAAGGGNIAAQQKELVMPVTIAPAEELPVEERPVKERYELRFSVSKEVLHELEEVKALLSSKYPCGAKLEDVFHEALEVLLEQRSAKRREARRKASSAKRKAAAAAKHQAKKNAPAISPAAEVESKRAIPQELRDKVFERDNQQCGFVSKDGVRCGSRHDLEVHHLKPRALGGGHELQNISLRCRAHNAFEAERDFGREYMRDRVALATSVSQSKLPFGTV